MSVEDSPNDPGRSVALFDLFSFWWSARVRIVIWALSGLALTVGLFAIIYAVRPSDQMFSLGVRLKFARLETGEYPNGTPFSPQDLIAPSVLQQVYSRAKLQSVLSYEDFKDSVTVVEGASGVDRLRREYEPLLSDRKLTSVERSKLEDEFESKLKAQRHGEYKIVGLFGSRYVSLDPTVVSKLFIDVIEEWSMQSRSRGVFKFDVSILTSSVLADVRQSQDELLMRIDRFRLIVGQAQESLNKLANIPGSKLLKVGPSNISVAGISANLQEYSQFRVGMLQAQVLSSGSVKDRAVLESYYKAQVFRLKSRAESCGEEAQQLEQAMISYTANKAARSAPSRDGAVGSGTMISQFSDSFLDRMLDLSTQKMDAEFRQALTMRMVAAGSERVALAREAAYYEDLAAKFTSVGSVAHQIDVSRLAELEKEFASLVGRLESDLESIQALHGEISAKVLNPSSVYQLSSSLNSGVVVSLSMLKISVILVMMYIAFVLTVLAVSGRKVLASFFG